MKKFSLLCAVILFVLCLNLSAQLPTDTNFVFHVSKLTIPHPDADRPLSRECVTVYPDGNFRYERVTQFLETPHNADFKVYKGQLSAGQLQALEQLLADPKIVSKENYKPDGKGASLLEGDMINIYIRRKEALQAFYVESLFGVRQEKRSLMTVGGDPQKIDDKSLFKPLFSWIGDNVEKAKGKSLKGTPAQCPPPAGGDKLKKPPISG
jgi:hypothetical protein